jgi:hypothetical protein
MVEPEMKYDLEGEIRLMETLWSPSMMIYPEAFVKFAYPWGQQGTPLADKSGPRTWQSEELVKIGEHNLINQDRINNGENPIPYNLAIASGRGPGKSAFISWIADWLASTRPGCAVIVTANTEQQLLSRTWPEFGKWHTMSINSHWFKRTATSLRPASWFEQTLKEHTGIDTGYYYVQAQLWSEENPDAFAGAHNEHGIALLMDEASGIPKPIWTVSDGFFTEPIFARFWIAFSNPRRPSGEFFECFNKNKKYWNTRSIDSRTVEGVDRAIFDKIIEREGEDSDIARVEVKGQFPRRGSDQLIGFVTVENACRKVIDPADVRGAAKIIGVDVARFGDDSTVLQKRQGLFAHEPIELVKLDNMQVAGVVAAEMDRWEADVAMVDVGGGQGVIDRLKQLGYNVIEVDSGSSAMRKDIYLNKRIEMWDFAHEWLLAGGVIPQCERLISDLTAPTYGFLDKSNKKFLESVDSMKKRGLRSPDFGSALVFTFAFPVSAGMRVPKAEGSNVVNQWDIYDPKYS